MSNKLNEIAAECVEFDKVLQKPYTERNMNSAEICDRRQSLSARLLIETLRHCGIGSALLSFEGCGDSGYIQYSKYSANKEVGPEDYWDLPNPCEELPSKIPAELAEVWNSLQFSGRYLGSMHTENEEPVPSLEKFVEWFGIYLTPRGFEINEGSSGIIAICTSTEDEAAGKVYVQTGWNQIVTETEEFSI